MYFVCFVVQSSLLLQVGFHIRNAVITKSNVSQSVTPEPASTRQQRIRDVVAAIPPGSVASYGEVAERAGVPRGARLVGRALRETPEGIALPWHRVLRADGRIAFSPGSRAFREQARRLRAEGVKVLRGRADMARHGWRRDLDAELWGFGETPTETRSRGTHK